MKTLKVLGVVGLMLSNLFFIFFGIPRYRPAGDNWMVHTVPMPDQVWPFDKPLLHLLIWHDKHWGDGLQIHVERETPPVNAASPPGIEIIWRLRVETIKQGCDSVVHI